MGEYKKYYHEELTIFGIIGGIILAINFYFGDNIRNYFTNKSVPIATNLSAISTSSVILAFDISERVDKLKTDYEKSNYLKNVDSLLANGIGYISNIYENNSILINKDSKMSFNGEFVICEGLDSNSFAKVLTLGLGKEISFHGKISSFGRGFVLTNCILN